MRTEGPRRVNHPAPDAMLTIRVRDRYGSVRAPWKGRRGCSTLAAMIDFFRDLEERLLRAEVRRSPDEVGKLLASDFIESAYLSNGMCGLFRDIHASNA